MTLELQLDQSTSHQLTYLPEGIKNEFKKNTNIPVASEVLKYAYSTMIIKQNGWPNYFINLQNESDVLKYIKYACTNNGFKSN